MADRRIGIVLALVLAGCPSGQTRTNQPFRAACETDAECASKRCLPGLDDTSFCSQECGLDLDCANEDSLYCCERLGEKSFCTQPATAMCRLAALGDGCQGANDPFCARSQLFCADAGGRNVCTRECVTAADCSEVRGAVCAPIAGGQSACIPPDINNLERLTSNCAGDRDCTNPGEICQVLLDNDVDPRTYVTVCTSSQKYGERAAYAQCNATRQCDRFFCVDGSCPAICTNDSHCRPGFVCEPVGLPVPTADGAVSGNTSVVGLCSPQTGSYRPCDSSASSCPGTETCQITVNYDGGGRNVCRAPATVTSTTPPVSASYAKVDEACSRLVDEDANEDTPSTWTLVSGEIKLCESGMCLAPGYCSAVCKTDTDCAPGPSGPTGNDLVCTYEPFATHCERSLGAGAALGAACSGSSLSVADAQCASAFCTGGVCTARKAEGQTCQRSAECRSFACLESKCAKTCRSMSDCSAGFVCETTAQILDLFGTSTLEDDAVDLPSFCTPLPGVDGTVCPQNACGPGLICRPIGSPDGGLTGLCASPNTGAAVGEACEQDAQCQTKLCLGPVGSRKCSTVCIDGGDCSGGTRCTPITLTGTAPVKVCLGAIAGVTLDDDAACTQDGACKSGICAEGKCATLCPRGIALGSDCTVGRPCALAALSMQSRLTNERYDDAFGYVAACITGAVGFTGDVTTCAAPKQFVFRPNGSALVGACVTPIPSTLAEDAACQAGSECQSGLCVDNKCSKPCATTPADSCGATLKCDIKARAQLGSNNGVTAVVPACRATCTADAACGAKGVCEPDDLDPMTPRFCRATCAADKDCAAGQTCSPEGSPPRYCLP
jgi:hypothetical protein